jgi:hypothetical protein
MELKHALPPGANRIAASDGEVQPFRKASTTSDLPRNWRSGFSFRLCRVGNSLGLNLAMTFTSAYAGEGTYTCTNLMQWNPQPSGRFGASIGTMIS